jgi:hypothetical protein
MVKSFENAGISLLDGEDWEVICHVTPQTYRCLIEPDSLAQYPCVPDERYEDDDLGFDDE